MLLMAAAHPATALGVGTAMELQAFAVLALCCLPSTPRCLLAAVFLGLGWPRTAAAGLAAAKSESWQVVRGHRGCLAKVSLVLLAAGSAVAARRREHRRASRLALRGFQVLVRLVALADPSQKVGSVVDLSAGLAMSLMGAVPCAGLPTGHHLPAVLALAVLDLEGLLRWDTVPLRPSCRRLVGRLLRVRHGSQRERQLEASQREPQLEALEVLEVLEAPPRSPRVQQRSSAWAPLDGEMRHFLRRAPECHCQPVWARHCLPWVSLRLRRQRVFQGQARTPLPQRQQPPVCRALCHLQLCLGALMGRRQAWL